MSSPLEILGEALLECTCQVLDDAGVPTSEAVPCAPGGDWLFPMAVIGFGGESVRGSISIEVQWEVLSASHPTKSTATEDLVDWVAELSNLVMGKLKTKLRGNAVAIQPALPMTFTTRATESGVTRPPQLQYQLRTPDGLVVVRFSAAVDATFQMGTSLRPEVVHGVDIF